MEGAERQAEQQRSPEIMVMPDISVREEPGVQALSLMLKANDLEWGDTESPLAREASDHFTQYRLDPIILNFFEEARLSQNEGVDEESLYILALTYHHPERTEAAMETLRKHKGHISDPEGLRQRLFAALDAFTQAYDPSPLATKFASEAENDIRTKNERTGETRERIESLIAFFKPDSETSSIRKVVILPTDPLYGKDAGSGFVFGDELILRSHVDNPDNLEHEFLHCIVNPIVDKLDKALTEEQKGRVSLLASGKLKHEQEYGTGYYSLLCEELIRTYNDVFKHGETPRTIDDLRKAVDGMDEETFGRHVSRSESLRARCRELGISNLDEFKASLEAYFEKYERNALREMIYKLYEEYAARDDETENFERFILRRLPESIER